MQISGYSSAAMLAYRSSGMKQKAGTVKMQDFSQMVQNTSAQATSQTDKTAATKEVSEVDEMAAFKQEIYEELAEIDKMNSSAILSNSVHMQELLMGFHLVSMLQQQLQELEQLATGQMFTMMIVQQPKPLKRIWLIRRQKVHFIIQIAPMLTVEPHSARGTESMWQVNAKSGNLCRR